MVNINTPPFLAAGALALISFSCRTAESTAVDNTSPTVSDVLSESSLPGINKESGKTTFTLEELTQELQNLPSAAASPHQYRNLEGLKVLGKGILQGEFRITSAKDTTPILGAEAPTTGVILTAYNPVTRTAAIAHLTQNTHLDSVTNVIREITRQKNGENIQVRLFGGNENSHTLAAHVLGELKHHQRIDVVSADFASKALCIDSRTGMIMYRASPTDFGKISAFRRTRHTSCDTIWLERARE